jgi:hypothetical protein
MGRYLLRTKEGGEEVPLKVIKGEIGKTQCQSEPLGIGSPDQQCGGKTWSRSGGHGTKITRRDASFGKCAPYKWIDSQKVIA